jgi:hypothetical protein
MKTKGTASPLFVKSDDAFNQLVAKAVEIEKRDKGKSDKSGFARDAIMAKARRMARRNPELKTLIERVAA